MTVFVDPLLHRGWRMYGRSIKSSHLFTDENNLGKLHALALRIGMKRAWFQDHASLPHYDLTPTRRAAAVLAGAVEVSSRESVAIIRAARAL